MPYCFLCSPSTDLLVHQGKQIVAISGLGPISAAYLVVAAHQHAPSIADLDNSDLTAFDHELTSIRMALIEKHGNCLVAEHGRVPVCQTPHADEHDAHCYHAHALLFAGVPDVIDSASKILGQSKTSPNLVEAMSYARNQDHYVLISPNPDQFNIFPAYNIQRQLIRFLVAEKINRLDLYDWRQAPNREQALSQAQEIKTLLEVA